MGCKARFAANSTAIGKKGNAADRPSPRYHTPRGVMQSVPMFMSNSAMSPTQNPDTTDQRLTELEIKASFNEDAIDRLDQVIVRQQHQIDSLIREILQLRQQRSTAEGASAPRNLRDELPPHY